MLDRLCYMTWTGRMCNRGAGVGRRSKASMGHRLWIWFWRQCLPPHTGCRPKSLP